jgi:hypothetical protein
VLIVPQLATADRVRAEKLCVFQIRAIAKSFDFGRAIKCADEHESPVFKDVPPRCSSPLTR